MLKDIFFLLALVIFACVDSWGSVDCYQQTGWSRCSAEAWDRCDMSVNVENTCPSAGSGTYTDGYITDQICNSTGYMAVKVIECKSYCCNGSSQEEVTAALCSQNPDLPQCPHCDSTKWTCETFTETTQTTIANDNVTCFNGECYGGIYCEYITRNETTCTNECGTSQTEIAEFPMRYEGRCNEETAPDEDMCTSQKCMTNNGFYHLYRLCKNRNIVNGESQTIPVFEGGGVGTCANAGYKEENPNVNGGSSSSSDSISVPVECYTMGINCPVLSDSTDYTDSNNRNQDNGCTCEPYDGYLILLCSIQGNLTE